jgi:tetratricopeptide (TPR) repeat protein
LIYTGGVRRKSFPIQTDCVLPRLVFRFVVGSLTLIAALCCTAPILGQSSARDTSHFAALAAQADAARAADQLDEAVKLYKKALALHPRWAEGWWSLGTIAYDRSEYTEASRAFQKAAALNAKNGNVQVMLGLSEFELGHDELALKYLENGRNLGIAKDVDLMHVVLYHEGVLLQRKGKFQAAQETLQQLCLQGVESDEAARVLGMTLLRMRSRTPPPPGSEDADIVLRVGHAACLAGQKKFAEARTDFGALVHQHPKYPSIHYAFGMFLVEASDFGAANLEFQEEINNNPGDLTARLQIAAAMYKVASAAGIPYAEEAVKLAPQNGFAHYLLGLLLLDTNSYEKALPELEIAQKTFPREAKLYFALGSAYSRAGRKKDALRARATFERLTREGEDSSAAPDESGLRGSVQGKIGKAEAGQPPQ